MRIFTQMQAGFAPRLAALYAGLFIMAGIQLPFFPVWLKAKGLDSQMIGLVLAAPIVARLFAVPLVARVADRRDALRAAIIVASWLGVAGFVLVGLAEGPTAILIAYALAGLALTPVMPLAETYALKGLAARGRAYGPVRLWGSVAFILGTFLAGFATDTIPARYLIWLIAAASLTSALAALTLAPLSVSAPLAGCAGIAAQAVAARSSLPGRGGGGEPDPVKPRSLLRLFGAGMARRRPRRQRPSPRCGGSAWSRRSYCSRCPAGCRRFSSRRCC